MVKIIKVRNCFECPYGESNYIDYRYIDFCFFDEDNPREIDDRFTMPDWCPLEEEK